MHLPKYAPLNDDYQCTIVISINIIIMYFDCIIIVRVNLI